MAIEEPREEHYYVFKVFLDPDENTYDKLSYAAVGEPKWRDDGDDWESCSKGLIGDTLDEIVEEIIQHSFFYGSDASILRIMGAKFEKIHSFSFMSLDMGFLKTMSLSKQEQKDFISIFRRHISSFYEEHGYPRNCQKPIKTY